MALLVGLELAGYAFGGPEERIEPHVNRHAGDGERRRANSHRRLARDDVIVRLGGEAEADAVTAPSREAKGGISAGGLAGSNVR